MRRLFDAVLEEGRPSVIWPGWHHQKEGRFIVARKGDQRVSAHNFTVLLAAIRKAEGESGSGGRRDRGTA
jgi:hypothetical protein